MVVNEWLQTIQYYFTLTAQSIRTLGTRRFICICIKKQKWNCCTYICKQVGNLYCGSLHCCTYVDLPGTCTYLTMYTVLESIKKRSTLASSTRKISPLYLGGEGEGKYWTTHAQWSMYPPESNSLDKLWPRVPLGLARFSRVTLS